MSKHRASYDESEHQRVAKLAPPSDSGPTLFDPAPEIRTAVPSVRATGSEDAADSLDQRTRSENHMKILDVLAALEPNRLVSRHWIQETTGLPINVVTGRVNDLMPTYIEGVRRACPSHVKARLRVEGLRLTRKGRERCNNSNIRVA